MANSKESCSTLPDIFSPPSLWGATLDPDVEEAMSSQNAALQAAFAEMDRRVSSGKNMRVVQDGKLRAVGDAVAGPRIGSGEVHMFMGSYAAAQRLPGFAVMNGKSGTPDMTANMTGRIPMGAPDKSNPGEEASTATTDGSVKFLPASGCSPGGTAMQGALDTTTVIFLLEL